MSCGSGGAAPAAWSGGGSSSSAIDSGSYLQLADSAPDLVARVGEGLARGVQGGAELGDLAILLLQHRGLLDDDRLRVALDVGPRGRDAIAEFGAQTLGLGARVEDLLLEVAHHLRHVGRGGGCLRRRRGGDRLRLRGNHADGPHISPSRVHRGRLRDRPAPRSEAALSLA